MLMLYPERRPSQHTVPVVFIAKSCIDGLIPILAGCCTGRMSPFVVLNLGFLLPLLPSLQDLDSGLPSS